MRGWAGRCRGGGAVNRGGRGRGSPRRVPLALTWQVWHGRIEESRRSDLQDILSWGRTLNAPTITSILEPLQYRYEADGSLYMGSTYLGRITAQGGTVMRAECSSHPRIVTRRKTLLQKPVYNRCRCSLPILGENLTSYRRTELWLLCWLVLGNCSGGTSHRDSSALLQREMRVLRRLMNRALARREL